MNASPLKISDDKFRGKTILVVDDDELFRTRLARAFRTRELHVLEACSGEHAGELLQSCLPNFAVIDLKMPGAGGLVFLTELQKLAPNCQSLILTGYGSIPTAIEAVRLGAVNYLTKPLDADRILQGFFSEHPTPSTPPTPAVPPLHQVEWEHIQRVVNDCQGNISKAAKLLGIHRRSLQRKLNKNPFS